MSLRHYVSSVNQAQAILIKASLFALCWTNSSKYLNN